MSEALVGPLHEPLFTGSSERKPEPTLPEPLEPRLRENGHYVPDTALIYAVDVALMLGQPLLLTGEPGTGKTTLAAALAHERFDDRFLEMQVKSDSTREDLLYHIDQVGIFRDSQAGRTRRKLLEYLTFRPLGEAILRACPADVELISRSGAALRGDEQILEEIFGPLDGRVPTVADLLPSHRGKNSERVVVLIDEIDKAPRDTPNDLLEEFDRMSFAIPEFNLSVKLPRNAPRPVVIVTSNSEKSLPEAFLRRCAYHHIAFPGDRELRAIIASRLSPKRIDDESLGQLLKLFADLRTNMQRRPGTAELLQWLSMIEHLQPRESFVSQETLEHLIPVLAKNEVDSLAARRTITDWIRERKVGRPD
ncbi:MULTISPECIES: AAA family ATPase [Caballeronia]|uniref:MoxR family ATPase n=3 Tax=Caballeronia TaxID=1827195 RepID=A0AA37IJ17_9BURK|nr:MULTISPECIES: MoxR family ATPase [Caballeronia]GJH16151.1 MoxR family ATPase [Caballeronia novacaledonica]GJH30169.1 MoxR family ATPase [Caballeronia novacaledonica]